VDGEFGYDMREEQMAVVASCWVNAVFTQQAGPGESHKAAQFVSLALVSSVVNVGRRLLNQQTRKLQQQYSDAVGISKRILRINDLKLL
jgi:hypothetical protein